MTSGTPTEQRERELKFDLPADWTLPDLSELAPAGGSISASTLSLESTYYDTTAHDLLQTRLTLRRRTGDDDQGWQLKVPSGDARTELRLPLSGRAVPKQLQQLTAGVRRGAPLGPIARLRTRRDLHLVVDADGTVLAEVAVDDVTATQLGEIAVMTEWREAEVELKAGDEALLKRAAGLLHKSGASRSQSVSKLARALGAREIAQLPTPDTLVGAVRVYLASQQEAILTGDLDLRRGRKAIHTTRVGTRRYRSVLRVFAGILDTDRVTRLDAELQWYAGVLGGVRDLEVLRDHLTAELDALPPELVFGPVAARLEATLQKDLAAAQHKLDVAMRSRRYFALLQELHDWANTPPFVAADVPAAALKKYLAETDKKFVRRFEHALSLAERDPHKNEALHRARKAAKRARYTAELSEPVLGKSARAAVKRGKKMQDSLGDRQDAVLAVDFLRRLGAAAGTAPGENGFTFGILLAQESRRGHLDRSSAMHRSS